MDELLYPSVQGQTMPNLGLAQYSVSSFHLGQREPRSSGSSEMDKGLSTPETAIYTNSESTGPVITPLPELDSFDHDPLVDINQMGIDPSVPYFHLNLAGEMGVPSPAQLAAPNKAGEVIMPTFTEPDMCGAMLKTGDIAGAGLDKVDEMEPDPTLPDLTAFNMPDGLDIYTASGRHTINEPDPAVPDLNEYDQTKGLSMLDTMTPDPLLPDLQQPELTPEIMMTDRPGDLASDALGEMRDSATYKAIPTDQYKELYMDQSGNNARREKHEGMMDLGLEKVEGGTGKARGKAKTRDDDGDYDY